jgi:acetylornithine deacetylase
VWVTVMGHSRREVAKDIERLVADPAGDPRLRGAAVRVEFKGFMACSR